MLTNTLYFAYLVFDLRLVLDWEKRDGGGTGPQSICFCLCLAYIDVVLTTASPQLTQNILNEGSKDFAPAGSGLSTGRGVPGAQAVLG